MSELIIIFIIFSLFWSALVVTIFKSDDGDGKRQNLAGYMIFGFMWPIFKNSFTKPMSNREIYGISFVSILTIVLIGAAFAGVL